MKIKTKISLGLSLLFSMFLLVGGLSIFYLHRLAQESQQVLKDNDHSLAYTIEMLKVLNDLRTSMDQHQGSPGLAVEKLADFEQNLVLQEGNITEVGERELVGQLRKAFGDLQASLQQPDSADIRLTFTTLNSTLYEINEINSHAIVRKNETARQTAHNAIFLVVVCATICFLIFFSFIFSFPGYIADPVRELTERIKNIAGGNYNQRLNFRSSDEFGELALAFNDMTRRLDEYERSSLAKIISEKQRIETIIDQMQDPVIGLDERSCILFVNAVAAAVLGVKKNEFVGKYAPDLALKNDLLRTLLVNGGVSTEPLKIFARGQESYFEKEVLQIESVGKPIGSVILLRDVTQFQVRDTAKSNFLATVANELKPPIAAIRRNLQTLESGHTPQQQQAVIQMQQECQQLMKIAEELLAMTQRALN